MLHSHVITITGDLEPSYEKIVSSVQEIEGSTCHTNLLVHMHEFLEQ